jgi:nicotinamide mononucleotide (NMN) deamidase PncC
MSTVWTDLIERIHAAPQQAVIAVTGGGASAIADLLQVPGGSRTLLEAIVPYSEAALTDWLGKRPEHFCTEETALAMAAVALQRAGRLAERGSSSAEQHIGLGCTASLASERPKKGAHRCHIATQTRTETVSRELVLHKGARDRAAEERLTGQLILCALARAAGLTSLPSLDLENDETVVEHGATADPLLADLLDGSTGVVWSLPGSMANLGQRKSNSSDAGISLHGSIPVPFSPPAGLLCGSFHPLHFGHVRLREVAAKILGGPVYYEMSIRNVDKPPLDFLTIDRRRAQFTDEPLALTAAPTFAEKAAALPGVTFVVGADTAERIVAPRYYGESDEKLHAALSQIASAGCRFLVAGRETNGRFETLADFLLPPDFAKLFSAISPENFRADVSSSQIRRADPAP